MSDQFSGEMAKSSKRRFDASQGPRVIRAQDGKVFDLGSLGVRFMVWGQETGGGFSMIEHPIPACTLAAPLHRHQHEDEYSYVIEGRLGALLGEDVVYADVGDLVFKPRNQWHTFWNAGDQPCRILEIISPGGFEHMFEEWASDPEELSTGDAAAMLDAKYGIEADYDSIPKLCDRFGLKFPS